MLPAKYSVFMNPESMAAAQSALIHDWGAFWTVVCLGLVQIAVTWYNTRLSIDALPAHIPDTRRRRHGKVFLLLVVSFIGLTLVLAKLNGVHEYQADLLAQHERTRQEALEAELQRTLTAVIDSQSDLMAIRSAVMAHPAGAERDAMLSTLNRVTNTLGTQANTMRRDLPPQP